MARDIKTFLAQAGQSVTAPRLAVYDYLLAHDPATTQAVIDYHAETFDRASIYRTLTLYRELGVIQDVVIGGRRMIELTDTFDSHHHHLTCLECGAIATIEDLEVERRLTKLARSNGFEPVSHQVEVSGRCSKCLQSASKT